MTTNLNPCVNAAGDTNHGKRPTTLLGPRLGWWCVTCQRARRKAQRAGVRQSHVERTYGLSEADVAAIRAVMPTNGAGVPVCFGCQRATGAAKALAVDHDHELERRGLPMRETVRGFLCGPCNEAVGRMSVYTLRRLADYKENPPAFRALHTNGL